MTSEIIEFSNERKKRKALNFQNDKVRDRLFDISLAISNSLYNKTITNYEANKYLQEVRKYKRAHLWDNQTTEMSQKLITQLKIILSWNSLSSHKYSTRFRNPKTQSDSSNEDTAYETVDDMIDYFRQNKNHEQVSNSLCNKDNSGYKKTEVIKNKNQSSKKIKRTNKKHISRKEKLVKNKHKTKTKSIMTKSNNDEYANTDLLYVSPIDYSINTFISNKKKDNNINIASTTKKYLSQTITNSFNTNTNLETILGETHNETVKTLKEQVANDHVFARHLSQKAIDTNAMKRILDRECNSSTYQNIPGNNKLEKNGKYTGINFSFDCQDMKDTMNLCTTPIFNNNDINIRNKENQSEDIIPLNLSQNLQKINNNHSSKHCSQETIMHSGQIRACNKGNLIRTFLEDSNIGLSKTSHNGTLFHNNKSLPKPRTKKDIKPLLPGTISKCKGNSTIKETTNPKAKLLKIDGKKKGRPKKKNINGTINHETNLNNAIPNEVISLINSIKYVREIDEEENSMDIELPEEFWNNFDLPPDWDEQDLIF